MAKELPYYKHEPSEWLEGEIQVCSDESIVCFQNLCSGYWLKLGSISYAFALQKYCRRNANIMQELIDNGIIDVNDDKLSIKFLDKQLKEFLDVSQKRSGAARKRWDNANVDANALQVESKSNAIREEKRREEEIKEITIDRAMALEKDFEIFWNIYDKKVDTKKCKDVFFKLSDMKRHFALEAVEKYITCTTEKKYRKNPLTWLRGECWKDEMKKDDKTQQQRTRIAV